MKHVLVIAGSDPSGGAGVQADLTTLKDFGVQALFAITALTAQNEQKVLQIHPTPVDVLTQQLSAACEGKEIGACKIGMVAERANVRALVWFLGFKKFPHVVIDPILHSSSGAPLLEKKAFSFFRNQLLPLATVVTPNLPEASNFVGSRIYNEAT
ncbi:MAG: hydroxymethylpyrimidine/phosphomethylpyrimidine kinase, partial [Deltaproteobacteria bacterium]|nr:hydroxymethylpyrimidine/phosphomethylpyrimidine kinase [Deltaproteobacteria bacterium]